MIVAKLVWDPPRSDMVRRSYQELYRARECDGAECCSERAQSGKENVLLRALRGHCVFNHLEALKLDCVS